MDRQSVGKVCLALTGVTLDHPFGNDHDCYKVGGKMFAMVGGQGGLSFKVSDTAYEVLTEDGRARPAPIWRGPNGCIWTISMPGRMVNWPSIWPSRTGSSRPS